MKNFLLSQKPHQYRLRSIESFYVRVGPFPCVFEKLSLFCAYNAGEAAFCALQILCVTHMGLLLTLLLYNVAQTTQYLVVLVYNKHFLYYRLTPQQSPVSLLMLPLTLTYNKFNIPYCTCTRMSFGLWFLNGWTVQTMQSEYRINARPTSLRRRQINNTTTV